MDAQCPFCKILVGELPASFVYRDRFVAAFMDIHPINPGHLLIVPTDHYEFFEDIPPAVFSKMANLGQEMQLALRHSEVVCEGANFFLSNGKVAGQEVPHAHLHLTPRFPGDGHRMGFSGADSEICDRLRLDQIAKSLGDSFKKQKNWTPPVLEGKRVVLRPVVESDVEAIFAYCRDPEVSKFTTWETHRFKEDSMALVQYAQANYRRGLCGPYAVALKERPEILIGMVGWFWNTEPHKSIEIAYGLNPDYWGQGLIVEAATVAIDDALKKHSIHRISSRCLSANERSKRVMEKLGMKFEGTLRQSMLVKGVFHDVTHYSMLASDWL